MLGLDVRKESILVHGVSKNLGSVSHADTDDDGHPLENEDESGRWFCEYWMSIFQGSDERLRRHQHENILRYVQKAPDDIHWTIDRTEFDEIISLKKDSAPGPDGIPYGPYRCAGEERELGSHFLFNAYNFLLERCVVTEHFAESRTVFHP